MSDQVRPVPFGEALKISLDNYYDLLKTQVGGLGAEEYLQLKLVADPVDISAEKYPYYSQYNLLNRSDLAIEPVPVSGTILTSADQLSRVYGRFLQRLRKYAIRKDLSPAEQKQVADYDVQMQYKSDQVDANTIQLRKKWSDLCAATGQNAGDQTAFLQWSAGKAETRINAKLQQEMREILFDQKTITDRKYTDPEDREIIDAENDYTNPFMHLHYPLQPDYRYSTPLTLEYLASPATGTALFDDRYALTWNVTLENMKTMPSGAFTAHFDRNTTESKSVTTDWSYSGSVSYAFISVKTSVSDHQQVVEDFKKGTSIDLSAKAAFKTQIVYPGWFRSQLFRHKRVKENIRDFEDFFGPIGTLRYYPMYLILVRGFSSSFESAQKWTYDYERKFNASAGGGFSVFGINFGDSWSYGSNVTEHKVDSSNTTLKISDGDDTLRFVGYVVKKNTVWDGAGVGIGGGYSPIAEPGAEATALKAEKIS
jgi:hypothetical protein